jgi:NNP family nitrate/nitrite transporter-like MFS transporter
MYFQQKVGLAKEIMEHTVEGIMVTETSGKIISVNPAFKRITGYQEEEVIGKKPNILKSGKQSKEFYENLWKSLAKDQFWQGEVWNRRKNGEIYPQWLTISSIKDDAGEIVQYAAMFSDKSSSEGKSNITK